MSGTTKTPNYNLLKPNVGADNDLWGDHLNTNSDTLDALIKTVENKAGVTTFNTRTGAVTLNNADVVTVLPGSVAAPAMDGTATAGLATTWAKGDHVHPTDTTRYAASNPSGYQTAAQVTAALGPYAPLNGPVFTGDARAVTPSPGDNDTSIATTAFVTAAVAGASTAGVASFNTRTGAVTLSNADVVAVLPASSTNPSMDGTAAVGTGTTWARADHVHPSDTTKAPLASPLFTGDPRSVTPPNGDNDFSIATTAFVQTAVAPALNGVGRNLLHNPLFNVAQRGTGPFAASGYTLDRWFMTFGSDTMSVSWLALADADRSQIGDEAAQSGLVNAFTGNAAAGAFNILLQYVENVRRLSGKSVTVSFWARATAGTPKVGVSIDQSFGTGGSPSASVSGVGQAVTISTTWARYSLTFAVPSASGKTLGTNGDHSTIPIFWFSSGATNATRAGNVGVQSGTIALWGVQLEVGSVATPLEKPDPQQDLAKCQRFARVMANQLNWTENALATGYYFFHVYYPVSMRAAPTVTMTNTGVSNINLSGWINVTTEMAEFYATATATATLSINFTLLVFSADL